MNQMKFLWVALLALTLFTACSKKESDPAPANPDPEPAASAPFAAKVDGNQFTGTKDLSMGKYVTSTKMLQVIGQTSGQKETIHFSLMNFDPNFTGWKAGTYTLDPANVSTNKYLASAMYTTYNGSAYENWTNNWDHVKNGQIIIETISETHLKGTFQFDLVKQNNNGTYDAANVKKITAGTFDLDIKKM